MEDLNMLSADCVVLCCCCQCLILQILVLILLRLPYKLARKFREYVKKKFGNKKRKTGRCKDDGVLRSDGGSFRIKFEGLSLKDCRCDSVCCMEEVEKVLEELSQKGDFAFGSFWVGDDSESFPTCLDKQEIDYDVVRHHLIESFGSFNFG